MSVSRLPYHHTYRMVSCMKTTLNIDDTVMRRLREEAARRQTTMSSLVEAGLRRVLADAGADDADVETRWRRSRHGRAAASASTSRTAKSSTG